MHEACSDCTKTFSSKSHLKRHTNTVHYMEHHLCQDCYKVFVRRDNLRKHQKRTCKKQILVGTVINVVQINTPNMGPALPFRIGQANTTNESEPSTSQTIITQSDADGYMDTPDLTTVPATDIPKTPI